MRAATRRALPGLACLLGALAAGAAEPPEQERWVLSQDGAGVIDQRSKLVWARCVEGMSWDGRSCVGKPLRLSLPQANARAAARSKAEGLGWRLPRANELRGLMDKSARPAGPNARLFPAAPPDWHWSATVTLAQAPVNPYNYGNVMRGRTAETASQELLPYGWAVHMGRGEARGDVPKNSELLLRLLRPQD